MQRSSKLKPMPHGRVDQLEQATGQPNRWKSEDTAKEGLAPCQAAVWCMLRSLFPDEKSKSSVYLGLLLCQLETCKPAREATDAS